MSTFVLVHGAWQGPRTWDRVVPLLQEQGHKVIAPVLTGLGDNAAQLSSAIDLTTHIDNVIRVLTQEDLRDVILIGHSYAGMVITRVADKSGEQLRRLVYLDAFLPKTGQSALDLLPADIQALFRDLASAQGGGWRLPANDGLLDIWGLPSGSARDFARERLSDFSLHCFEQKLSITRDVSDLPGTFVHAVAYPGGEIFRPFAESAGRRHWDCHEVQTGHQCQIEAPEAIASILLAHAAERQP
jgi:pimeloyl-ACP methyl ester carboxylesterase